ncbi:MAG: hypothetical protein HC911_03770 [Chloroflexaceae bacterium]|nr:hypothetical protein [Chloroflexaceae bacterium]
MSKFSTQLLVFLSTIGLLIFADYGIGIMQANSSTPPSGDLAQWWASTITPTPTWDDIAYETERAATDTAYAATAQAERTAYAPTWQAEQTAFATTEQAVATATQVYSATTTALALTKTAVALQPTRSLPAEPQTLLVTTLESYLPGSLQWQIGVARSGDTIQILEPGTISLLGDRLTIAKDLTIIGPGSDQLAISANNQTRVLAVLPGVNATLQGVTLRDGAGVGDGGAVLNRGNLTMRDVVVRDSRNQFYWNTPVCGGGIYNDGTLTLIDSLVTNNHVVTCLSLDCSGLGGGLCNVLNGTFTLQNSTIANNTAQSMRKEQISCSPDAQPLCIGSYIEIPSLYPDIFSQDQLPATATPTATAIPPDAATPTAISTAPPAPLNLTPRLWLPFVRSE